MEAIFQELGAGLILYYDYYYNVISVPNLEIAESILGLDCWYNYDKLLLWVVSIRVLWYTRLLPEVYGSLEMWYPTAAEKAFILHLPELGFTAFSVSL